MTSNAKLIAFYLPQFHPTTRNNQWWGKGFTEWTNVAKAKKLYPGHYQPHIPADLGFYDLRLPEVRKAQADMAREYGVYGFCYYHYWFENGFEELERPLDEVVKLGEPDFPFCLCWANESWYSKFWNKDGTVDKKILAEQKYLGEVDHKAHFLRLLPAFKDARYIKYEGRLLFVIYKPLEFEDFLSFKNLWNNLAKENGLPEFYFVGYSIYIDKEYNEIKKAGFESIISCHLYDLSHHQSFLLRSSRWLLSRFVKVPGVLDYKKLYKYLITPSEEADDVIPTLLPNWDHSPRSGRGGVIIKNATPENFELHVKQVIEVMNKKKKQDNLCFLKSWNEWGEGNYVEPDQKYGYGFLRVLKKYFG